MTDNTEWIEVGRVEAMDLPGDMARLRALVELVEERCGQIVLVTNGFDGVTGLQGQWELGEEGAGDLIVCVLAPKGARLPTIDLDAFVTSFKRITLQ